MVPGPGGRPYLAPAGRVDLTAIANHQRKRGLTALPVYGLGITEGEFLSAGSLFVDHLRGEERVQLGIDRSGGLSVRTVPGLDLR